MLDIEWLNNLRALNFESMIIRLIMAMLIGGILGIERGRKNRPAGLRTYMLVSVGSALVMMTNQYVFEYFKVSDPVRLGAQVISGIGFLGAGTIIMTGRAQVKGITTAAGLWTAACSGLAIGIGFYEGALLGGIAIYAIMVFMQRFDEYSRKKSQSLEFYVELELGSTLGPFLDYMRGLDFTILDMQINKVKTSSDISMTVLVWTRSLVKRTHEEMIEILSKGPGCQWLEEI